jgi:hypothetical protein
MGGKTPNPKPQYPTKPQIPSSNPERPVFAIGISELGLGWSLGFGHWLFVVRYHFEP